jgi:hypothetical protein
MVGKRKIMNLSNELKDLKKELEEKRKRLKETLGHAIMADMDELQVGNTDVAGGISIDSPRGYKRIVASE